MNAITLENLNIFISSYLFQLSMQNMNIKQKITVIGQQ